MFGRLDQSSADFLATLPERLAAELPEAVGEPFTVEGLWRGGWSNCYLLVLESGRKLVLKHPRFSYPIDAEIARLERAREVGLAARRFVPELHSSLADDTAYLAEYIPGENLATLLRRGVRPGLGGEIALALRGYHAGMGEALGDFNPGNVIVRDFGVTFVDPGDREKNSAYAGQPMLVADLGRWLAFASSSLPVRLIRRPRQGLRGARLTASVLSSALGPEPGGRELSRRVEAAALRELKWMPHASMARDRWAYHPVRVLVRATGFVVRRRLSKPRAL